MRRQQEVTLGVVPKPLISEADYPTFRMLLGKQVPATFEEWKRIPITPQDFIGYCQRKRLQPTKANLRNCAADQYGRQTQR